LFPKKKPLRKKRLLALPRLRNGKKRSKKKVRKPVSLCTMKE
jgi:hypothetical protein